MDIPPKDKYTLITKWKFDLTDDNAREMFGCQSKLEKIFNECGTWGLEKRKEAVKDFIITPSVNNIRKYNNDNEYYRLANDFLYPIRPGYLIYCTVHNDKYAFDAAVCFKRITPKEQEDILCII